MSNEEKQSIIKAFRKTTTIDINAIAEQNKESVIEQTSSGIILDQNGARCYISEYGIIAYAAIDEEVTKSEIVEGIKGYDTTLENLEDDKEEIVVLDHKKLPEYFSEQGLVIEDNNEEQIIIALKQVTHSILLEEIEDAAQEAVQNIGAIMVYMTNTGKVKKISKKELRQNIGQISIYLYILNQHISVFELQYDFKEEGIKRFEEQLRDYFQIEERGQGVYEDLEDAKGQLQELEEMKSHAESRRIEWIIAGLILFEVVQILIDKFL